MKSDDEWEVQHALDTLLRAEEIKADKRMMKKVTALAKKQQARLSKSGIINKARAK